MAYAVERFGEARPPQDLYVLVVLAGFAGKNDQNGMILGGPAALLASRLAGDRVTGVTIEQMNRPRKAQ
jgi:hypothetical protein